MADPFRFSKHNFVHLILLKLDTLKTLFSENNAGRILM